MARSARRYDVYLPLKYNDGSSIEDEKFDEVERQLIERFNGLTSQQHDFPLRGIWQGATQLYLDQVIMMTVLDFRRNGSTRFMSQLKRQLLKEFDQEEILVIESLLRVH